MEVSCRVIIPLLNVASSQLLHDKVASYNWGLSTGNVEFLLHCISLKITISSAARGCVSRPLYLGSTTSGNPFPKFLNPPLQR